MLIYFFLRYLKNMPKIKKYGYSIPFSNEGKKTADFLESLKRYINLKHDIVICLADQKTSDLTKKILKNFIKKNKNFKLLNIRSKNFTETRISGLKNLKSNHCHFCFDLDGNGSHDPSFIPKFKRNIENYNLDAVFGTRFKNYKKSFIGKKNTSRILLSFFGHKIANFFLNANFSDTGGYICVSKYLVTKIIKNKFYSPAHFFHYELKYLLKSTNYKEVSISYRKSSSKISFYAIFNALKTLSVLIFLRFK